MSGGKTTGPAVRKVLPMIVIVDVILVGGGVLAFLRTNNPVALGVPIVLGAVIVSVLLLRAKAADAAAEKPRTIVE